MSTLSHTPGSGGAHTEVLRRRTDFPACPSPAQVAALAKALEANAGDSQAPAILIVDDAAVNLELLDNILTAEGFRTLTAVDGLSARELARRHAPDLILLDVVLPGESGFETCAALKSDPRTADIPIIFLSALGDVKSKVRGLKIGGVDYVSKPVHGEELLARVRVHLRLRENSRALIREQQARLEQLRDAQRAILVQPEELPDAAFEVCYRPLEEASGDFYDVLALADGAYGYFVADISGHGASAAFLTSAVKALLRQYASPMYSPEDALRGVDAVMQQILGEEQYLTALFARLNRRAGTLTVLSAGHPPLILVTAAGRATVVEADSDPLGIFGSLTLQRKELRISRGDRFFMFSDGVIEPTPGAGRHQGLEALVEACVRHRALPMNFCLDAIVADMRHGQPRQLDDFLLLGVEADPQ